MFLHVNYENVSLYLTEISSLEFKQTPEHFSGAVLPITKATVFRLNKTVRQLHTCDPMKSTTQVEEETIPEMA